MMMSLWIYPTGVMLVAENGHTREVTDLYQRFGPAVYRRALALLRDEQEAMDVTQETFLAFFKQRSQFRQEASAFTLLYQMATFQSVDRLRRRSRWSGALQWPKEMDDDVADAAVPRNDGQLLRVEAAQDLALLTRGEKPDVLTAAFLYFVEGYTTEEIGQTLDVSRRTVSNMLSGFVERAQKRYQRLTPGNFK